MSHGSVTRYTWYPTGCDPERDVEAFSFQVDVEWRGKWWYVVSRGFNYLSRAGNWKSHPQRFQMHQYRWDTLEEANAMAAKHTDEVTINGWRYMEFVHFFALKDNAEYDRMAAEKETNDGRDEATHDV